jgi:hypothetical protein
MKPIIKFITFLEHKPFLKNNKKNFNLFLKKNNYKSNDFIKKNYKDLLKSNILKKKTNFVKFKRSLVLLIKNIKYLQKLKFKKRIKILLNFFKN